MKAQSFLEFLFKNKHKFEQNGIGITLLDNITCNKAYFDAYLNAKRTCLLKNIQQLKSNLSSNNKTGSSQQDILAKIESILSHYYSVKKIEDLAVGNFNYLNEKLDKNLMENSSGIIYENSIINYDCVNLNEYDASIKKTELINNIKNCPLLENVYEYLNWGEYSNQFGDLKQFIERLNEENSNQNLEIVLLEVEPFSNRLYKLTRNTDIE